MYQRGPLLFPEHQATTPGGVEPALQRRCRETKPPPVAEPFHCAVQPLLGLDHLAAGEPIFAAPVLSCFDPAGRCFERRPPALTLTLPIAIHMDDHRPLHSHDRRVGTT